MRPALLLKRVRPEALTPTYGSPEAIGLDLYAYSGFELLPRERRVVPVGFAFAFPAGYYGRIAPRSGLSHRHGLDVLGGVIDPDYRGEVAAILINHGGTRVLVRAGSKIAQLICERADQLQVLTTESLPGTERGGGGFGSTGI